MVNHADVETWAQERNLTLRVEDNFTIMELAPESEIKREIGFAPTGGNTYLIYCKAVAFSETGRRIWWDNALERHPADKFFEGLTTLLKQVRLISLSNLQPRQRVVAG